MTLLRHCVMAVLASYWNETKEYFDIKGGLACCDSWGHRVGHDWETELNWYHLWTTKFNISCHNNEENV